MTNLNVRRSICAAAIFAAIIPIQLPAQEEGSVVNIYSARQQELIEPLLERFREQTGTEFNLVTGRADELLTRLALEAEETPADLFITVDAGRLHRAKEAGVLQPIDHEEITSAVPAHLQDSDKLWVGLSKRARVVVYAPERVNASRLSTYEALTDWDWQGRICIRSSSNIYNQSLVASLIASLGAVAADDWARGLVWNMARNPSGGDTDQIRAVAAGECDLAVVNTYYFGRLAGSSDPDDQAIANSLKIHWPNQAEGDRGTHVNVSGAGITKHAKNREAALALLAYLVSPEAQQWYAEVNFEYPVVPGTPVSPVLESFGEFREDDLDLSLLGTHNWQAVELMDRVGWR